MTILGTPVSYPGHHIYLDDFWTQKNDIIRTTLDRLTQLTDAQLAHHLLRKCLDGCKVNHLLRSKDCYASDKGLRECDSIILGAFEDLIVCGLSAQQLTQAAQPLRTGGCGIRCPLVIRPAARVAGLATFISEGAERVGVSECARACAAKLIGPPLSELQALIGRNFDPLPSWMADWDKIGAPDDQHLQQK